MKISDLIKSLQQQMQDHGDVDVKIYGSYDGGYYAGGDIEYVDFQQNGGCPFVELVNDEG